MTKDSVDLEKLLFQLSQSVNETDLKSAENVDISTILNQLEDAGKILDVIDGKADALNAKMDEIIASCENS
jgi:enoyl reductase-like protein